MVDSDEKLDDSWIIEFATSEKLYQEFYKNDIYYIDIHYVYINSSNEIVKINQDTFLFKDKNYISREDIIGLIKRNSIVDSVRYSIMSVLKYNITIETENIRYFLKNGVVENYLTPVKNIDTIKFEKTINMFQDLNDLLFIFYEKTNTYKNTNTSTKKIFIHKKSKQQSKNISTRKQYN